MYNTLYNGNEKKLCIRWAMHNILRKGVSGKDET